MSGAAGFRAHLSGASLWDLVQMECLARAHRVVQVIGEGGVGYLFLSDGRVIHAQTPRLTGEAAALEILSWTNGSFQTCERPWPRAGSIQTSCEALILQVARRRDEQSGSNLVAFPGRAATDSSVDAALEEIDTIEVQEIHEEGTGDMRSTNMDQTTPPAGPGVRADLPPELAVMLRLAPTGAVVKNGGTSEEVAEALAYAQRLVQLAGELLGLEKLTAMECTFGQGRWVMFTESNGDMVALRPRAETNLQPLRDRLGL